MINSCLTIAASDNCGGAGIQQDIKVAHDFNYWAFSAVTGITVQDFNKLYKFEAVKSNLLKLQIEHCLKNYSVKAVKIGAICSEENIKVIADCLSENKQQNVVLDPVLASSSGAEFLKTETLQILKEKLFPLTNLITPNKIEFEILCGQKVNSICDAIEIGKEKAKLWNTSILLKGGHFYDKEIKEIIISDTNIYSFNRERKKFLYNHGTGCTLSTAIACNLASGNSLYYSYLLSSDYLTKLYVNLNELLL
ncbi:MAG: hydroxymethylpyrimidine/phosphomethylpyrimidine kinase [Bacteroidota bacterium]|nr:hydroxymethylpyrimidine/phosphomethylpyrimidine kinase [Bacteroidota bacterium]